MTAPHQVDERLEERLAAAGLGDFAPSPPDPDRRAQEELGAALRRVRVAAGLSLQGVEDASGGVWKAVVVGSYERGDRAITIPRLVRYCAFLGVTIYDVLPTPDPVRQRLAQLEAEHEQLQRRQAMRLGAQLLHYAAASLEADAGDSPHGPQPLPGMPAAGAVEAAAAALKDAVLRTGVADDGDAAALADAMFTAVNPPRCATGAGHG